MGTAIFGDERRVSALLRLLDLAIPIPLSPSEPRELVECLNPFKSIGRSKVSLPISWATQFGTVVYSSVHNYLPAIALPRTRSEQGATRHGVCSANRVSFWFYTFPLNHD